MSEEWSFDVTFEFRDGYELEGHVFEDYYDGGMKITVKLEIPDDLARQGGERPQGAVLDARPDTTDAKDSGGAHPPDGTRRAATVARRGKAWCREHEVLHPASYLLDGTIEMDHKTRCPLVE